MNQILAVAAWPELASAGLLLVPVGSTEQHGPHLPLDTDTVISKAVATLAASRLPGSWVAPPVAYGASGEHQAFPGTSSIGAQALHLTLVELVRSVGSWASRVFFVNAHGGNQATLQAAVAQLAGEGHDVGWAACAVGGADAHAGRTETSLMLHLRPESVRRDRMAPGNTQPLAQIWDALREGGARHVSENGVLGDPAGATAEEGARILAEMTESVLGRIGGEGRG